jgi:hypothetical protein
MNANTAFSLVTQLTAVLEHPLLKRANLGFALRAPFNWALINAAAVYLRLEAADQASERGDQLKVKMATLRHFNRMATTHNEVGMGEIRSCLRPDEKEVSLADMQKRARERITMDVIKGRILKKDAGVEYKRLTSQFYEQACAEKRKMAAMLDEVLFLCNRSDDMLSASDEARCLDAHTAYPDAQLVDFDQYDYMIDGLLEKMTMPTIQAMETLHNVRSYRTEVIAVAEQLKAELEHISVALGINWKKLEDERKAVAAEFDSTDKETNLDVLFDAADAEAALPPVVELPVPAQRTVIKSAERQAREEAEAKAALERAEYEKKQAQRNARSAATRAANKAKSMADIGKLVSQA